VSNRLIQADHLDYDIALKRFIKFCTDTELIYGYIVDCGYTEEDLSELLKKVLEEHLIFSFGETDEEEVANIFSVLKYASDNDIDVSHKIARLYSSSSTYQEIVKHFNSRVVLILINHIERYLTKIGVDLGLDDKTVYNISVKNGQVNIATDNSNLNAVNQITGTDSEQLNMLVSQIQNLITPETVSDEDAETLNNAIETIQCELTSSQPKKSIIKTGLNVLKTIKGTAELGAAIAALIEFCVNFIH